jgi:hypothetical protein
VPRAELVTGRLVRVSLAATAALAVMGAGTVLPARTVSAEKYAKTVCTTIDGLTEAKKALVDLYNALPTDDAAALQAQSIALAEDYVDEFDQAEQRFRRTTPDIDAAVKVRKLFVSFVSDAGAEIKRAVDAYRAADPDSVAFQGDVIAFETAFNVLEAKLGDPFSKIKDQELLAAFDDERTCKDVVQVFG